jgi:hypothetical protein
MLGAVNNYMQASKADQQPRPPTQLVTLLMHTPQLYARKLFAPPDVSSAAVELAGQWGKIQVDNNKIIINPCKPYHFDTG